MNRAEQDHEQCGVQPHGTLPPFSFITRALEITRASHCACVAPVRHRKGDDTVFNRPLAACAQLQAAEKLELPFAYSVRWPHDKGAVEIV